MANTHPCPKCGYQSLSQTECLKCGIVFDRYNNLGIQRVQRLDTESTSDALNVEADVHPIFNHFKVNVASLPVGFVVAFLLQKIWVFHYLSILFCIIPLHEMGHAVTAWMLGRFAIPLGAIVPTAGMTIIGYEKHVWVHLVYFSFFGFLAYKAWKHKLPFLIGTAAFFIFGSMYLQSKFPDSMTMQWFSFGGIAGEFILSAILILSFYHPSFKKIRWDFIRYPFFMMGCMAFVNACESWFLIKNKLATMPFGSAISADGSGDSNGDLNKLIANGWSEDLIIERYLTIGKIAFTIILIQYIYRIVVSYQKKSDQAE